MSLFDVQPETETILIQTFQEMMKLPPSCEKMLESAGGKRRKSSYVPRQKQRGPYRTYTVQEKNHVVHLHTSGMTFAAISKMLKIPQKNVVRWCKEGFINRETSRRVADSRMEELLSVWLKDARKSGLLKHVDIQQKARELSTNSHFKASRGWLKNFLRRFSNEMRLEAFDSKVKNEESEEKVKREEVERKEESEKKEGKEEQK